MLVRAYLRAYGLVFVVFAVIVYWAFLDREHQRDIVLADTAVIATQQSQLISKGVTFFHVAARYLLGEVVSSVEDEHLSQLQSDEELRQFYNSLLQNKLLDAPFLHGLSIIGSDCSTLAANDALHRSFTQTPARCDQLWQTSSPVLQMHVLGPGQTVHAGGLVAFSRQITSQSGEFLGAVTTGLDLDFVKDWFGHYASRNNESITLLGPDGQVLAHMTYGLSEIRAHEVFLIMRASAHDTGVENSQDARNAQYAQSDRNASGNSVYGSAGAAMRTLSGSQSYLGEEAVYALSRVDGLPMYVLVSYDIQRQLANWREHSVKTGLFVFWAVLAVTVDRSVLSQSPATARSTGRTGHHGCTDRHEQPAPSDGSGDLRGPSCEPLRTLIVHVASGCRPFQGY
ncbi:hypothetical protein [Orrella marina]|uniref:hypothetical protein n=1 Tax=Orrella marina TaxID=2163011 RepID=UPI00131F34EA|nr:hypothetical protein [Orrella marina]